MSGSWRWLVKIRVGSPTSLQLRAHVVRTGLSIMTLRWFAIEEDAWEAPFCILLTDDADEMGGTFLNLQVSVSVGLWLGADWRWAIDFFR